MQRAREIQRQRFAGMKLQTNTDMGPGEIQTFCPVDETGRSLLKAAMSQLHLSARAYHRAQSVKLARAIPDLAGFGGYSNTPHH